MSDLKKKYSLSVLKILINQPNEWLSIEKLAEELINNFNDLKWNRKAIPQNEYVYSCPNCKLEIFLDKELRKIDMNKQCGKTKENGKRCGALRRNFKYNRIEKVEHWKNRGMVLNNLREREIKELLSLKLINKSKTGYHLKTNTGKTNEPFDTLFKIFYEEGQIWSLIDSAYYRSYFGNRFLLWMSIIEILIKTGRLTKKQFQKFGSVEKTISTIVPQKEKLFFPPSFYYDTLIDKQSTKTEEKESVHLIELIYSYSIIDYYKAPNEYKKRLWDSIRLIKKLKDKKRY